MNYRDGKLIEKGDSVLIECGKTSGVVHEIIETSKDMNQWGVTEKGLMIKASEFGLVFWPELDDESVVFVMRAKPIGSNSTDPEKNE